MSGVCPALTPTSAPYIEAFNLAASKKEVDFLLDEHQKCLPAASIACTAFNCLITDEKA